MKYFQLFSLFTLLISCSRNEGTLATSLLNECQDSDTRCEASNNEEPQTAPAVGIISVVTESVDGTTEIVEETIEVASNDGTPNELSSSTEVVDVPEVAQEESPIPEIVSVPGSIEELNLNDRVEEIIEFKDVINPKNNEAVEQICLTRITYNNNNKICALSKKPKKHENSQQKIARIKKFVKDILYKLIKKRAAMFPSLFDGF